MNLSADYPTQQLHVHYDTLPSYPSFLFIHWTQCGKGSTFFFLQVTSFVSLFLGVFQAFLPSFCAAVCHCCAGLVSPLYTGGLCAFPCLSPCSHSNLLPESLLLPFSAWAVVAMPPHHTVIAWSSMATTIRGCRETVYMLDASSVKSLLTINELKKRFGRDIKTKAEDFFFRFSLQTRSWED